MLVQSDNECEDLIIRGSRTTRGLNELFLTLNKLLLTQSKGELPDSQAG